MTAQPQFSLTETDLAEALEAMELSDEAIVGDIDNIGDIGDNGLPELNQVAVESEHLQGRQRRISARIQIPYSIEQIWQILTDYEHLADFIPNLSKSHCLSRENGIARIEQIGAQSFLKIKFCARVVLDMVEQFPNELDFRMIEGDFKEFFGSWQLQPVEGGTTLSYTLTVLPPRTMPIGLIEKRLQQNLAVNLTAIYKRAEELFGGR